MTRRRVPLGLIAPIALLLLLGALGVIQYRWVGQVSERERDELRVSLDRRARAFADDFDREITRAFDIFSPDAASPADISERLARDLAEWRSTSRFSRLIKGVHYVETSGSDIVLRTFDPNSATLGAGSSEWPLSLAPVRARFVSLGRTAPQIGGGGTVNVVSFTTGMGVMPNVPAILVPDLEPALKERTVKPPAPPPAPPPPPERPRSVAAVSPQGAPGEMGATFQMLVSTKQDRNHIVLELDREFIATEFLPALAASHFPTSGDAFRVFVADTRSAPVFSRGLPANATLELGHADAAMAFFGLRAEMMFSTVTERRRTPASPASAPPVAAVPNTIVVGRSAVTTDQQMRMMVEQTAGRAAQVRTPGQGGWMLFLQHPSGSLDAVVTQARRRNLMLSFGILGVLGISAGLIVINARRAEKLAAQQMEFVATVSHELRTPLAVIRSAAQNLSAGVISDAAQARKYGELIEGEGRRLTDMVEQVLEYAGLSDAKRRGGVRAVDAGAIVRDVVTTTSSLPEVAEIALDVSIEPNLPPILADEEAVRRALHNLIGNAIKYAADGRWIGVTAARGSGPNAAFVTLSVADRGRGIPSADLAHIFEPFFRGRHAVDQQIRGNGLGLSLVKRVVESVGGRVTVQSAPDQGTTFALYLPIATGVGEAAGVGLASPSLDDAAPGRGPSA